jgi:hypothetical protein
MAPHQKGAAHADAKRKRRGFLPPDRSVGNVIHGVARFVQT